MLQKTSSPAAEQILKALRKQCPHQSGQWDCCDIRNACPNLKREEVKEALGELLSDNLIERTSTGGFILSR